MMRFVKWELMKYHSRGKQDNRLGQFVAWCHIMGLEETLEIVFPPNRVTGSGRPWRDTLGSLSGWSEGE